MKRLHVCVRLDFILFERSELLQKLLRICLLDTNVAIALLGMILALQRIQVMQRLHAGFALDDRRVSQCLLTGIQAPPLGQRSRYLAFHFSLNQEILLLFR